MSGLCQILTAIWLNSESHLNTIQNMDDFVKYSVFIIYMIVVIKVSGFCMVLICLTHGGFKQVPPFPAFPERLVKYTMQT